jgi:hypothetical protein
VQRRAVGHDDVVAAIRRRVPSGLVLAHEDCSDPACQAPERGGRLAWLGGEGGMQLGGGYVMPYSRVGESGLQGVRLTTDDRASRKISQSQLTKPIVCDILPVRGRNRLSSKHN